MFYSSPAYSTVCAMFIQLNVKLSESFVSNVAVIMSESTHCPVQVFRMAVNNTFSDLTNQ